MCTNPHYAFATLLPKRYESIYEHERFTTINASNVVCSVFVRILRCMSVWWEKYREQNNASALRCRLNNPDYNDEQNQRYKNKLSGYHHLYYRVEENYIGVTNSLDYRRRNSKCELFEYGRFKHKLDALIVEAILQFDYGFSGWHRIHAPSKIKAATPIHKRLAKRISVRIFTV